MMSLGKCAPLQLTAIRLLPRSLSLDDRGRSYRKWPQRKIATEPPSVVSCRGAWALGGADLQHRFDGGAGQHVRHGVVDRRVRDKASAPAARSAAGQRGRGQSGAAERSARRSRLECIHGQGGLVGGSASPGTPRPLLQHCPQGTRCRAVRGPRPRHGGPQGRPRLFEAPLGPTPARKTADRVDKLRVCGIDWCVAPRLRASVRRSSNCRPQ